ncbi:MAG TPA: hypothetical protein VHS96_11835 [Bacteroidia bacterium]|nr:hypothetical protein [Bacteroidia bacterium]
MEIVKTLRNLRLSPATDAQLADLRREKWGLYTPPAPIALTVQGQEFRFRPGLTLTPFANAVPCTAHCRFCSEELQRKSDHRLTAHAYIRDYDAYFNGLKQALLSVKSLPIGLSLSGLEATAEPRWLLRLLDLIDEISPEFRFDEKVLYTNGSGLLKHPQLVPALEQAAFDRIELSRCHPDQATNQRVMYINRNEPVWENAHYEDLVRSLQGRLFVKNSCILTQPGVNSLSDMEAYLDWAADLGVKEVVFRELSRLDDTYLPNATAKWVEQNRVPIEPILQALAPSRSGIRAGWHYLSSTLGYYYYNEHFLYRGKTEVIIETSSYPALQAANALAIAQKLVFHSNGNLCGDWDPDAFVIGKYF